MLSWILNYHPSFEMVDLLESVHKKIRTLIKYNGIHNKKANDSWKK